MEGRAGLWLTRKAEWMLEVQEREETEVAPEGLGSGTWWDVRL